MKSKKKSICNYCQKEFKPKGLKTHERHCRTKLDAAVNQASTQEEVNHNYQRYLDTRYLDTRRELDQVKGQLQRKERVLNGYRETLGAAGRLLASLVDVSEIN